jgi:hypothetical protein
MTDTPSTWIVRTYDSIVPTRPRTVTEHATRDEAIAAARAYVCQYALGPKEGAMQSNPDGSGRLSRCRGGTELWATWERKETTT